LAPHVTLYSNRDGRKNGFTPLGNSINNNFRIEEYEAALKEWEENKPPGSASSLDPAGYKKKTEEREIPVSSIILKKYPSDF
jgi:hypothetical protein